MSERILLTGATGFFGRRIAEALRQHKFDVVTPGRPDFDLMDAGSTLAGLKRLEPTSIIHSAAYYGGLGICMAEPTEIFYRNVQMGINLLEAAAKTGVRKMMAIGSACAVSGRCRRRHEGRRLLVRPAAPLRRVVWLHQKGHGSRSSRLWPQVRHSRSVADRYQPLR